MENDAVYQYIKLVADYFPAWLVLVVIGLIWLIRNPSVLQELPKFLESFKIGSLEVEFREVKEEIKAARQQVEELQNEVALQGEARIREIMGEFEAHAPAHELSAAREAIKATAPSLENLDFVRKGLGQTKNHKELYAAAEVARTRRDIRFFDDLVASLDHLARADDLHDIRLLTVWTMTSALHKTLVTDIKHTPASSLSVDQLEAAKRMLHRLVENPRVLQDRPDDPIKGVRGPAKWAESWIDKALAKRKAASG